MSSVKRKLIVLAAVCSVATVFQLVPGSCAEFAGLQALGSIDFCAVLNCEGGAFFNFCNPVVYFVDCLAP